MGHFYNPPSPFIGGSQPLDHGNKVVQGTPPSPYNPTPPFAVNAEIIALSQPSPWPYVFEGGFAPYLPRPLNPFFEAVEVDNPVPNADWLANLHAIRMAWEPPPPLPTLTPFFKNGIRVDQPQPNANWIANLATIRSAWEPPPPAPTLRNPNNILFGVRVDNPPFRWLPSNGVVVRGAPVFVQLQGSFNATTLSVPPAPPVPTPVNLETILSAWVPPPPPPVQRGPLNPSITAVPVNNPPLGVYNISASCVYAWYKQPPDPLPTLNYKIFPYTAFQPWVSPSLQTIAASAWGPPPPLPTLPRNINPLFLGVIPPRAQPVPFVLPQYLQHSIGEMFTDYNFANRTAGIATYYGFDLTNDLLHNEQVISTSWQCIVVTGTDPNAASCLSGPSFMQGKINMQLVIGGVSGVTYQLLATITTSFNNIFYRWSNAPCL